MDSDVIFKVGERVLSSLMLTVFTLLSILVLLLPICLLSSDTSNSNNAFQPMQCFKSETKMYSRPNFPSHF